MSSITWSIGTVCSNQFGCKYAGCRATVKLTSSRFERFSRNSWKTTSRSRTTPSTKSSARSLIQNHLNSSKTVLAIQIWRLYPIMCWRFTRICFSKAKRTRLKSLLTPNTIRLEPKTRWLWLSFWGQRSSSWFSSYSSYHYRSSALSRISGRNFRQVLKLTSSLSWLFSS
jgi:hypothetical protein